MLTIQLLAPRKASIECIECGKLIKNVIVSYVIGDLPTVDGKPNASFILRSFRLWT